MSSIPVGGPKPSPWNVNPGEIDPRWRWAWTDLVACVPFWEDVADDKTFREIVTGRYGIVNAHGHDGSIATFRGRAVRNFSDTVDTKAWLRFTGMSQKYQDLDTTAVFTMFMAIIPNNVTNSGGNDQRIVHWSNGSAAGNGGTWLGYAAGSTAARWISMRVDPNTGGNINLNTGANTVQRGQYATVMGAYDSSLPSDHAKLYWDGVLAATATNGGGPGLGGAPSALDELWIGDIPDDSTSNRTFKGDILIVYFWAGRAHGLPEAKMLHMDPFGPIRRYRRPVERNRVHIDHG